MIFTKPITFLKEVRDEMQRVAWPSRDQAIRLTTIVIAFTFGVGVYIGLLDLGLTRLTATFFIR